MYIIWGDEMIEMRNVSFAYAGDDTNASIQDFNLSIPKGQVLLLSGPSGCGKSTVLRLINGLAPHYYEGNVKGEICVDGKEPKDTPLYEMAPIVGSVFQNPRTQFYNVDTTGELAFACENQRMPVDEIRRRMDKTINKFQIEELIDRNIFHLSGGQKQQIACASVDVAEPDIFLLDEPTANLDYEATQKLKRIIAQWKKEEKTILIAEHRIAWIWELCDRLLIMNDGKIVSDLTHEKMKQMTSKHLVEKGLRTKQEVNPIHLEKDRKLNAGFHIKHLAFSYHKRQRVLDLKDFAFSKHQITALVGANGIGKTTLLHCLSGILRKSRFIVEEDGKKITAKSFWKRTFLVMQDVNHQLFTESVLEEVLISMDYGNVDDAKAILSLLNLDALSDRHPMSLSGGEKQRVAIACAFASGKDILLFDEPTSGLDRYHMELTVHLFQKIKAMGKTILLVTHDSELIELCCDQVIRIEGENNE